MQFDEQVCGTGVTGVTGAVGAGQALTFIEQVLVTASHWNGPSHAIHSPLTSYGADFGHSQACLSLFQT